jgi:hypoxanthine phosphoribosyltransferase
MVLLATMDNASSTGFHSILPSRGDTLGSQSPTHRRTAPPAHFGRPDRRPRDHAGPRNRGLYARRNGSRRGRPARGIHLHGGSGSCPEAGHRCDFLAVRSYGAATETSGVVEITHDLRLPIAGQHVLVVEDIAIRGSRFAICWTCSKPASPASLHTCALLEQAVPPSHPGSAELCWLRDPDLFVVGYGLDHDQRHRNLPYLGVIE